MTTETTKDIARLQSLWGDHIDALSGEAYFSNEANLLRDKDGNLKVEAHILVDEARELTVKTHLAFLKEVSSQYGPDATLRRDKTRNYILPDGTVFPFELF